MSATNKERKPKTSTVRHVWAQRHPFPLTTDLDERYAEFDRWLAEHDARIKAEVLRKFRADVIKQQLTDYGIVLPDMSGVVDGLDEEAERIEKGHS